MFRFGFIGRDIWGSSAYDRSAFITTIMLHRICEVVSDVLVDLTSQDSRGITFPFPLIVPIWCCYSLGHTPLPRGYYGVRFVLVPCASRLPVYQTIVRHGWDRTGEASMVHYVSW